MIENAPHSLPTCANEACPRPAEPGEAYCGDCDLERSLYRRDSRHAAESSPFDARPEPTER